MIYINEDYLKLEWDETARIIIAKWAGYTNSTDFRAGLAKGLEIITNYRATNWLADVRNAKVLSLADQNYQTIEWTPQAIERGLKRIAYVVPEDVIAQMALNRIDRKTAGLETHHFSNVKAARDWLVSFRP